MNQHEVARRWAKQSHQRCRTRSMFFEGDTIYSWGNHWPLGRVITLADSCRKVAVIHNVSHTSSTNRHRSQARWAAYYEASISKVYDVEHDLFPTIHDEATLADAIHKSVERAKDRAYEDRIRRNERARRDRECNGDQARAELERELGRDLDAMSGSFAIRLRNLLIGVPGNNFQAHTYRSSGERRGGLLKKHPALLEFMSSVIDQDPDCIKRPSYVLTLIDNFQQLAA